MSVDHHPSAELAATDGEQSLPVSEHCFVCGRHNARGLQLRFSHYRGEVRTRCTLDRTFNGFNDRAHGGIVATLLDETLGWATVLAGGRFTYTAELNLRFLQPVPLGIELSVTGRTVRVTRRLIFAEGEIAIVGGSTLVTATGKFVPSSSQETALIADALLYRDGDWCLHPIAPA
jgi:uncharacterized protein (TIGR00369 family)